MFYFDKNESEVPQLFYKSGIGYHKIWIFEVNFVHSIYFLKGYFIVSRKVNLNIPEEFFLTISRVLFYVLLKDIQLS